MFGQAPGLFDLADDGAGHHRRARRWAGAGLPGARHCHSFVESFHRIVEVAHEVAAAKLAVGENLETEFFLALDYAQNVLVFERAQLRSADVRAAVSYTH